MQIASLGLESLIKIGSDGKLHPHLAQSVQQVGNLRFEYTLRKGVKFWDGNELTAADVANSLNYYRYKGFFASSQLGYPAVRSIRAAGRYKVVVTLKRPDAAWPSTPALYGWIFEKKFQQANGAAMGRPGVLIMGTGPWKFDSLDPTRGIEMSANTKYWGGKVNVQRVSVKFIGDQTNLALAFRAGDIDFSAFAGGQAFEAASGLKAKTFQDCGGFWFSGNTRKPPWNDIHVRRAVAYAVVKPDIIKATGGPATPISTMIPPQSLLQLGSKAQVDNLLKSLPQYPHSLAKARAEMKLSRFPNGFTTDFPVYEGFTQFGQVIAAQLATIGIKAQLRSLPIGPWVQIFNGPRDDFDAAWIGGLGCEADPGSFASNSILSKNAAGGKVNYANYKNPAADALIEQGQRTLDPAKRFDIYAKLLQILAKDVPYVPLYSPETGYAISNRFTFPSFNRFTTRSPGWLLGIKAK